MGEEDDTSVSRSVAVRQAARALETKEAPMKDLEARVAAMRRLGVTKWDGIELGPVEAPPPPPGKTKPRRQTKDEVHFAFWSKLRRSSGAPVPACTERCACGAWRMTDERQDRDMGDEAG